MPAIQRVLPPHTSKLDVAPRFIRFASHAVVHNEFTRVLQSRSINHLKGSNRRNRFLLDHTVDRETIQQGLEIGVE